MTPPPDPLLDRLAGDRSGPPPSVAERVAAAAAAEGLVDVAWTTADSPIGSLLVAVTERGLVRISYGGFDEVLEELAAKVSPRVLEVPSRSDEVRRQLDEYWAGTRKVFDVPIDRSLSSPFYRRVLEALFEVPYGRTVHYVDLARIAGSPGATRAVGTAMRTNPIPIIQPCHRVLPSDGSLGNYAGGVERKQALLAHEGAVLV
jgi:methylated-DNA-[protein]-cysteine S-methyltransferase